MVAVSIILPTYNRADTIGRAMESVLRQSYSDWELVVVDDGSTDDTAALVANRDPRIRLIRQSNGGCYAARNAGIAASLGRYLAFLDSDDEWLPHFLEVTTSFLESHPADHFVTTEFLEDWGTDDLVLHDAHEAAIKYPEMAWRIGSRALRLPPGETDHYLRLYDTRERVGSWGQQAVARAGYPDAQLYRGNIFEHMRWGYLNWLPTTVVTRHAVDVVGPFLTTYRSAADFRFLALLARNFRANMIALPCAIKHDGGGPNDSIENHLAAGPGEYRFVTNKLGFLDELFWRDRAEDAELQRVRALHELSAARIALRLGMEEAATAHLQAATDRANGSWDLQLLRFLLRLLQSPKTALHVYDWAWRIIRRLRRLAGFSPRAPAILRGRVPNS